MIVSQSERNALANIFGLLAEDCGEREIRTRIGWSLLDLLRADHFASFVWDATTQRFDRGVWINMSEGNLARYDAHFQYHDPITFALQARRHATPVSAVMPHRALVRTEFFNDFLKRDGLHWGINLHAFDGAQALGDLRIWRGRQRREFEPRDKALLDLIEPAFVAALRRSQAKDMTGAAVADFATQPLSPRESEVLRLVGQGHTDKQIAREMAIGVPSVRTYLQRIASKTGVQRRVPLAQLASSKSRRA
jgi:DNA-binding CsgD family transcriptional regulator